MAEENVMVFKSFDDIISISEYEKRINKYYKALEKDDPMKEKSLNFG